MFYNGPTQVQSYFQCSHCGAANVAPRKGILIQCNQCLTHFKTNKQVSTQSFSGYGSQHEYIDLLKNKIYVLESKLSACHRFLHEQSIHSQQSQLQSPHHVKRPQPSKTQTQTIETQTDVQEDKRVAELTMELRKAKKKETEVIQKLKQKDELHDKHKQEITQLSKQLKSVQDKHTNATSAKQELQNKLMLLEDRLQSYTQNNKQLKKTNNKLKKLVDQQKERVNKLADEVMMTESYLQNTTTLAGNLQKMTNQLNTLQSQLLKILNLKKITTPENLNKSIDTVLDKLKKFDKYEASLQFIFSFCTDGDIECTEHNIMDTHQKVIDMRGHLFHCLHQYEVMGQLGSRWQSNGYQTDILSGKITPKNSKRIDSVQKNTKIINDVFSTIMNDFRKLLDAVNKTTIALNTEQVHCTAVLVLDILKRIHNKLTSSGGDQYNFSNQKELLIKTIHHWMVNDVEAFERLLILSRCHLRTLKEIMFSMLDRTIKPELDRLWQTCKSESFQHKFLSKKIITGLLQSDKFETISMIERNEMTSWHFNDMNEKLLLKIVANQTAKFEKHPEEYHSFLKKIHLAKEKVKENIFKDHNVLQSTTT